jgi:hypothetical protein
MWTGPIEVTVDELFLILSPNAERFASHDESYIHEDDDRQRLLEPYDPSNMFNIFTNQLKLRPKVSPKLSEDKKAGEQSVDKGTIEFFKNLRLQVNKVHIRFEDDVLNGCDKPFCFGIIMNVRLISVIIGRLSPMRHRKASGNSIRFLRCSPE